MTTQQPQPDKMTLRVIADTHSEVTAQLEPGSAPEFTRNKRFIVSASDSEKKEETQKQAWFENAIKKKLKIPNSYVQVAVLIVKWDPELDNYSEGHEKEIIDLKRVFGRFGFLINSEVCLSTKNGQKPQNILNNAITAHINRHDGANKLMIIYYTGHGLLDQDSGRLMLAPAPDSHEKKTGEHHATAFWYKAEAPLLDEDLDADVLTIFDCCFASNGHKGGQDSRRIYDLLAACPKGDTTPAPGPNSFTRRLINTLDRLLGENSDQRILTTRLLEELNKKSRTQAELHDRLYKEDGRHVQLRPINGQSKQKTKQDAKAFNAKASEEAGIKLRFSLQERDMPKEKIELWAQELIKACDTAGVPVRRIDWIKMEERHPKQMFRHAVKAVRRMNRRRSIEFDDEETTETKPAHKKRLRSNSLSPSMAKRRLKESSATSEVPSLSGLLTPQSTRGEE